MENLSNDELKRKAKNYDNVQNEGGEGYNPYRTELDRRAVAAEAARPKTIAERKDAILHKIETLDCSIARESGTFDQARVDALRADLEKIEQEEEAAFLAEWTMEETKSRRAGWNDFVRSLMDSDGRITDGRAIYKRQVEQGWRLDELKKAIKIHNL